MACELALVSSGIIPTTRLHQGYLGAAFVRGRPSRVRMPSLVYPQAPYDVPGKTQLHSYQLLASEASSRITRFCLPPTSGIISLASARSLVLSRMEASSSNWSQLA